MFLLFPLIFFFFYLYTFSVIEQLASPCWGLSRYWALSICEAFLKETLKRREQSNKKRIITRSETRLSGYGFCY